MASRTASGTGGSGAATTRARRLRRRPEETVHFLEIHGHRRAYRVSGDAGMQRGGEATDDGRPTILLLHGIGDRSESWLPVMSSLAQSHRVIAPDLLGHGMSDKPRADYSAAAFANGMRDLLTVLGVERVTMVGHSLGGGVAAQFSYQYPHMVERLVLVAAGGVDREVSPMLRVATLPLSGLVVPLLHTPIGRFATNLGMGALKLVGHGLGTDADEVNRVLDGLPEDGAFDAFTRTLGAVVDWQGQVVTMRDRIYLARDIPMAIMWGDRDAIIPVEHAHQLHDSAPWARCSIFAGAGHFPHHSDPDRFVAELTEFVAATEPAAHDETAMRERLHTGTSSEAPIRSVA